MRMGTRTELRLLWETKVLPTSLLPPTLPLQSERSTYSGTSSQDWLSLNTADDCSPATTAFRDEKFFTSRHCCEILIHLVMTCALLTLELPSPPTIVAMTTRDTLLKWSIAARTVGAYDFLEFLAYERHWCGITCWKICCACVIRAVCAVCVYVRRVQEVYYSVNQ